VQVSDRRCGVPLILFDEARRPERHDAVDPRATPPTLREAPRACPIRLRAAAVQDLLSQPEVRWYLELMFPLIAAAPRMIGMMLGFQLLPANVFPPLVRNAVAISFSMVLIPLVQPNVALAESSYLLLAALLVKEVFVGFVLGYALGLPLAVFESAGTMIDTQSGENNASIFDPQSGHEGGPMAMFLRMLATALLLMAGLFAVALELVFFSHKAWPLASFTPDLDAVLTSVALPLTTRFWEHLALLAFPVVAMLLLAELAIGLINRAVPQLNVFAEAMPLKAWLAVLMLILQISILVDDLSAALLLDYGLVRDWLRLPP
jgi:type III secretion protein T